MPIICKFLRPRNASLPLSTFLLEAACEAGLLSTLAVRSCTIANQKTPLWWGLLPPASWHFRDYKFLICYSTLQSMRATPFFFFSPRSSHFSSTHLLFYSFILSSCHGWYALRWCSRCRPSPLWRNGQWAADGLRRRRQSGRNEAQRRNEEGVRWISEKI